MDSLENVGKFYDETVNYEWRRLGKINESKNLSTIEIQRILKKMILS